ncbi:adenylyltransferase/cytidyltransferase family protein [Alphaproteobacteria bacterium]|nr:adenylyltransferase/cytidyltransferase family protein [Alphaproteobacteria bacterium]
MKKNSIGIYGGSFNPFHKGHEYVIQNSKQLLGLSHFYVVPSYDNPLKLQNIKTPISKVLMNLRNSVVHLNVKVTPLEYSLKSQSTYNFLKKIQKKCLLNNFVLIIGLDQLWELEKWVNFEWIIQKISICIINRPGYDIGIEKSIIYSKFSPYFMKSINQFLLSTSPNLFLLNINGVEISSTEIRNRY